MNEYDFQVMQAAIDNQPALVIGQDKYKPKKKAPSIQWVSLELRNPAVTRVL